MMSIFGAGLLVGTALAVIIPEGVQALYDLSAESAEDGEEHGHRDHATTIGLSLISGFVLMLLIDNLGGGHAHSHGGGGDHTASSETSVSKFFRNFENVGFLPENYNVF